MLTRKIKRRDEEFVVQVSEEEKKATVTDERGTIVTISYNSGNFNVRLPNGWGAWKSTMKESVNYAVAVCFEARTQLAADQAYQEMVNYVKDEEEED